MSPAYSRSAQVHTVVLDGEAVLLDEHAGRLHRLNEAGTAVWLALDGEATASVLARVLTPGASDDTDAEVAVLALLGHLVAEGLVE